MADGDKPQTLGEILSEAIGGPGNRSETGCSLGEILHWAIDAAKTSVAVKGAVNDAGAKATSIDTRLAKLKRKLAVK